MASAALFMLAGCDLVPNDSPVKVDVIGRAEQAANPLRDSNPPAAKAMLGAVAQGLLSYDSKGELVDALAESWIVEDGGQSYIFRLKRLRWPNGDPVKAEEVARLLRERMRANPLSLAGLKPDVRSMTDRVIEIRLDAALPSFMQLLAQPQFGILSKVGGTGPYRPRREGDTTYLAPIMGTGPDEEVSKDAVAQRQLTAVRGALALERFKAGATDLVLGGRFQHLRLVMAAKVPLTDLRVDPVAGLLGLAFTGSSPFIQDVAVRDALSRAFDRASFAADLGLPGWRTTDTALPAPLELDRAPSVPAWSGQAMADRIASARQIVDRWKASQGEVPLVRVALPEGAGATLLFLHLARDFGQIGVRVDRVAPDEPADLRLIDEVAPFDSAFWYLSRLDCAAGLLCDPAASALLASARQTVDEAERARLLGEAEQKIGGNAGYLPLGTPIRWALVGRRLNGFQASPRGIHPLNRLILVPN